ncbi:hypothetical protein N8865_00800, partial [Francisellaceae bacterium]|nr:hypothetical protein [Francisellaceae bacterium]
SVTATAAVMAVVRTFLCVVFMKFLCIFILIAFSLVHGVGLFYGALKELCINHLLANTFVKNLFEG